MFAVSTAMTQEVDFLGAKVEKRREAYSEASRRTANKMGSTAGFKLRRVSLPRLPLEGMQMSACPEVSPRPVSLSRSNLRGLLSDSEHEPISARMSEGTEESRMTCYVRLRPPLSTTTSRLCRRNLSIIIEAPEDENSVRISSSQRQDLDKK
uniref:Uncharacterized protein n=1 Tax=Erythrolobus madagascarensis TaxID=708628 RepID=A0A7S0T4T2_9RHOD|mmetsp:Transcript_2793/g.6110  ORF Transcript_2793/g.6110 Transcript_2793/m.6110 type:complete len:152 (+) Transcript_2793:312-767(+)